MRHFLGNLATYVIAGLLLCGAVAFAWMRAAQVVVTDEKTALGRYEPARTAAFEWRELGASSYRRNCANCHMKDGGGWDQYPGLGHTAALFARPGGREYVVDLHLYGLASPRWRAPMPPMGHLGDVEMAAVLNHVLTHFGNERHPATHGRLYAPTDIRSRRGQRLSPGEVDRRRPAGGR